jgi:hypothetical protein
MSHQPAVEDHAMDRLDSQPYFSVQGHPGAYQSGRESSMIFPQPTPRICGVRIAAYFDKIIQLPVFKDLSHDPVVNEAYMKDPLVKAEGTLRGIGDMLNGVIIVWYTLFHSY